MLLPGHVRRARPEIVRILAGRGQRVRRDSSACRVFGTRYGRVWRLRPIRRSSGDRSATADGSAGAAVERALMWIGQVIRHASTTLQTDSHCVTLRRDGRTEVGSLLLRSNSRDHGRSVGLGRFPNLRDMRDARARCTALAQPSREFRAARAARRSASTSRRLLRPI